VKNLNFELRYLERDTPAFYSQYLQFLAGLEQNRWLIPAAGLEVDVGAGEGNLLSYFVADSVRLTRRQKVTLRLNHVEYLDWKIGINAVNLFHEFESKHWQGKIGLGYLAVVYDPDLASIPFDYDSEAPELRLLYYGAFRQGFFHDRFGVKLGSFDFTEFENYGYENVGAFVEPYLRLNDHARVRFLYEVRFDGLIYQLPDLSRTTMMVALELKP